MAMVTDVYRATKSFPQEERFELRSQIRRAAVSVPANIAEGKGRADKDFARFVLQARGSLLELETELLIARNLRYLDEKTTDALCGETSEIGRMLNGLLSSLAAA